VFHQTGARKKKSLTDPVKIIPFLNQNLRDKAQKAVSKSATKPTVQKAYEKPEAKVLKAPSGQLKTSHVSIKKMMEKKEESEGNEKIDLNNMPRNDYHYDELIQCWKSFAFTMKKEGKGTFYNALIKRDPKLKSGDTYILELDNQIQIDYIQPILMDLLSHIRKRLKNYEIKVEMVLSENPQEEVKFQTGNDKFKALARKNPNLHSLKNLLNLDIEF